MIQIRKFYDMIGDGSTGAYKDVDGDWIEYQKSALSSPSPLQGVEAKTEISEALRKGVNIGMQNVEQPRFEGDFNFNKKKALQECAEYLATINQPSPKVEGVEEAAVKYAVNNVNDGTVAEISSHAFAMEQAFKAGAEYASQFQSQSKGAGMEWVRAIERLPERGQKVFIKRHQINEVFTDYNSFDSAKYYDLPNTFWLDESPSKPTNQ